VVAVTVLGETAPGGAVRRGGAKVGDVVFVTGPLGGSLLGRHLRPEPRVFEALALREAVPLHALIDISDGLSSDLGHILDESGGLGAVLDAAAIPTHPDAVALSARSGRTPLEHALGDGEDFELCFTVAPDDARRLVSAPPEGVRLFPVGEVVERPGLWLRHPDGTLTPVEPAGFDHLKADPSGG
jgi:thiamine-monophosphate kinase